MTRLKKARVSTDVYTLALQRMNHVYDMFDHVAVSFSGGKDSTAVLNVALEVARERGRLPLRVIHFDEEALAVDVEDYVRRVSRLPDVALEWYAVPIKHRSAVSRDHPYWYPWAPEDRDLWCRDMPPEAVTDIPGYNPEQVKGRLTIPELIALLFPPDLGRCAVCLGIRTDESLMRLRSVINRETDNYIIEHKTGFGSGPVISYRNLWKVYPIYDWSVDDVWVAPARFGWDYCRYYDKLEMLGVSRPAQRLAPPFGDEPSRDLYSYAATYPDLWEKMVNRVPGANTGRMYSRTELYGAEKMPKKPEDVTWPDFLAQYIRRHEPEIQVKTAAQIRKMMRLHNQKTNNAPLMDSAPHPTTGLSWEALLQIAVRSDVKGRKVPDARAGADAWRKYSRALAAQRGHSGDE